MFKDFLIALRVTFDLIGSIVLIGISAFLGGISAAISMIIILTFIAYFMHKED